MEKIRTLSIDLETYSDVNLSKSGVYRYAESPNFEILLFGYSVNGGPVNVVDMACGETVPDEIVNAITDDSVIKWAFNSNFERICLSSWLRRHRPESLDNSEDGFTPCRYSVPQDTVSDFLNPISWRCSMVWCAYLGLPLSLDKAGAALHLEEQKMKEGRSLINYFSVPCKPTKVNGGRTRNLPEHDMGKWTTFKEYNRRDVETEQAIQQRLAKYPVPDFVWDEYHLDQEINDRGILLDMDVVENAIRLDSRSKDDLTEELTELTDLDNPNSVVQMKQWLSDNGMETDSLGKKVVAGLIETAPEDLRNVLILRQQLAKSSVKKYQAMKDMVCDDGRARGCFQFLGAARSGRWAGRHIQLQNLPQNHIPDLAAARDLVKAGDYETIDLLFGSVPEVLSELIRTAFIPRPGYKFVVSDFSAIEARVLSWLAGEQWRMDVFREGGDIYCATAGRMYHCNVVKHGENGHLRQKGKQAELSCGYGGGVGALRAMGALESGMKEDELQPLVSAWREANPNIVKFWWDVDRAAKTAVSRKTSAETHGITFTYQSGMLFVRLPSGRCLSYVKPRLGENRFGSTSVTYMGVGSTKKWERIETFGGKLVENITQAISRDILAHAMKTLRSTFLVAHVHDEVIIECSPEVSVEAVCEQMSRTPAWAPGLVLAADGYETMFYRKD